MIYLVYADMDNEEPDAIVLYEADAQLLVQRNGPASGYVQVSVDEPSEVFEYLKEHVWSKEVHK